MLAGKHEIHVVLEADNTEKVLSHYLAMYSVYKCQRCYVTLLPLTTHCYPFVHP